METKFEKLNKIIKNNGDYTFQQMFECGFVVGDRVVNVCDEDNMKYVGVFATAEEAEKFSNGKYFVEQVKEIIQDEDFIEDFYLQDIRFLDMVK